MNWWHCIVQYCICELQMGTEENEIENYLGRAVLKYNLCVKMIIKIDVFGLFKVCASVEKRGEGQWQNATTEQPAEIGVAISNECEQEQDEKEMKSFTTFIKNKSSVKGNNNRFPRSWKLVPILSPYNSMSSAAPNWLGRSGKWLSFRYFAKAIKLRYN